MWQPDGWGSRARIVPLGWQGGPTTPLIGLEAVRAFAEQPHVDEAHALCPQSCHPCQASDEIRDFLIALSSSLNLPAATASFAQARSTTHAGRTRRVGKGRAAEGPSGRETSCSRFR